MAVKKARKNNKLIGKSVVSLDLGQHSSKLVWGKVSRTGITVERAIMFVTPEGSVERGRIKDRVSIAAAIKDILRKERIKAKLAVATIENVDIITRDIVIPTAAEDIMDKALVFEAQQQLPIDVGSHIVQSRMVETFVEDDVSRTRFVATAMPEDMAKGYLELFSALDLKPVVLDVHSNSIDKLAQEGYLTVENVPLSDLTVAAVDFGFTHINVVIFEHGLYRFNRIIQRGAHEIDANLANFLGYSEEAARDKMLSLQDVSSLPVSEDYSDPGSDDESIRTRNVVRTVLAGWMNELDRIFRFYSTRGSGNSIDRIYAYGGPCNLEGFASYIADAVEIETICLSQLNNVTVKDPKVTNLMPFINAIGAMLRR